jgi:hypothetical protein
MPALGSREVLGYTRWRWVVHTGVGFETPGLVVHAGVRPVSVRRRWHWVVLGVARVVPVVSANMGYARRGLQEREQGWMMGAGLGIVDRAIGCLSIVVVGARGRLSKVVMSPSGRSLWWALVAIHRSW